MSRMGRNALEPGLNLRILLHVEAAKMRLMRIGIERDIGDRISLARQIGRLFKLCFHDAKRLVATGER